MPALSEVQRFEATWEKVASTGLRLGHQEAIEAYEAHGRVFGGERGAMLDALYRAWKADVGRIGQASWSPLTRRPSRS